MKKNVLALSISAALCGMGMVGSAYAITDLGVAGTVGAATLLRANQDGVGHSAIIPYYTAQTKNATAITLTNTTSIGKAVKVRFRGAENSDDILDFQVFLSPFDVWTASVSQSDTGEGSITTNDKSCTKPAFPAGLPVKFKTNRLNSATNTAGTREGYVEIFNMADVRPGTALATSIIHVAGVPPCSGASWNALDTDSTGAVYTALGLDLPTTGLVANWIIINTALGNSYSGQANATQGLTAAGFPSTANLRYWPQLGTSLGINVSGWTADPLFTGTAPSVNATMQDLPDMSTPAIAGLAPNAGVNFNSPAAYTALDNQYAAKVQASKLTESLAVLTVNNDFYNDTNGKTDWVFTMPTRRYNAAVQYSPLAIIRTNYATSDALVPGTFGPSTSTINPNSILNYFDTNNTALAGNVICVSGITSNVYNREEGAKAISGVDFSPSNVATAQSFCGEAGVWALDQNLPATGAVTAVLSGGIPNVAQGVGINSFTSGWLNVATPGIGGKGLPVIGFSFSKASENPAKSYGWAHPHTTTRVPTFVY